jgi:dihydrofolate synthase/folylpolyglutamate synthase
LKYQKSRKLMSQPNNLPDQPSVAPGAGATVSQWLTYLEAIHPTEIDLGLERVLIVLRRLFPGKPAVRVATVAGTNGKGSAAAALEALLISAGRRTGTYTSPHLQSYNERVRIDGVDIDDAALVSAFEKVQAARGEVSLTYFEFGTLAAFVAFDNAGVDDWVLEVGLGGRLDAVNVMDADLVILTSVDIDHVAFLGNDRETIGFEKAGVLRPGIPAVCADIDPPKSVLQQVAAQKVLLWLADRDYHLRPDVIVEADVKPLNATSVILEYQEFRVHLPAGPLPVPSVAAAVMAIRHLEPELAPSAIEQTLRQLKVPGRFEILGKDPGIFVDVGHNPHAARWLCGRLMSLKQPGQKIHAVYAALGDKDIEGVIKAMQPVVDHWWLAGLSVHRGLAVDALAARAQAAGVSVRACQESVAEAINAVRAEAEFSDLIIIFGSFHTVAAARMLLAGAAS